ncbi:MAG: hypothetical protein ACRD36_09475, partial [Candidatus Acidiferrum sp.]
MSIYSRLVRDVFWPLALRRRGETAQTAYQQEFEQTQWLSPDELHALQTRRLRSLLTHAYDRCPFYRDRFDRAGLLPHHVRELEDLRALPVLEKRDIQENGNSMIAKGWPAADRLP